MLAQKICGGLITLIFTFDNINLTRMNIIKIYFSILFLSFAINSSIAQIFTPIIFTEINYNSDSTVNPGNWLELYNKTTSPVDISGWYLKTIINTQYSIPAGTIVPANGYLVVVQDLTKFNPIFPAVTNKIGPSLLDFGNTADNIQLFDGTNTLITYVAYTDSGAWPRGADGWGHTLELNSYTANQFDASNWFDGCMFGSPGVAYTPCDPDIVFSEINYNSNPSFDAGDWLELHNTTGSNISLNGYSMKDSKDSNIYFIPNNITLTANGYRVLCANVTLFLGRHPTVTNVNGPFSFGFKSKGEAIRLFGPDGKLKFSVLYDNKAPWPTTPDSAGYTLELLDEHGKMDNAENWFAGCFEGSPGVAYDPDCGNGISELKNLSFNFEILNSLNDHSVLIHVSGLNPSVHSIFKLSDVSGREIFSSSVFNGNNELNTISLSAGLYIATIYSGNEKQSVKFVKP